MSIVSGYTVAGTGGRENGKPARHVLREGNERAQGALPVEKLNHLPVRRFGGQHWPRVSPYSSVSDSTLPYSGEVRRKALHLLALTIPLGMAWLGRSLSLRFLGPLVVIAVCADVARTYSPTFNTFIRWLFGPLMREEELPEAGGGVQLNGATCVLVGAFLLAVIFPFRVAVPVLVMTMLADAAAALVGRRWGRHPWGSLSSTVEGTAAFVGTGLLIMSFFPAVAFGPAAAGVGAAAVIEALPLPINDNIRVPLAAAVVVAGSEALFLGRPFSVWATLPA